MSDRLAGQRRVYDPLAVLIEGASDAESLERMGRELPICRRPVRCSGVLGGEMVAALSGDGLGGAGSDGWAPQADIGAA